MLNELARKIDFHSEREKPRKRIIVSTGNTSRVCGQDRKLKNSFVPYHSSHLDSCEDTKRFICSTNSLIPVLFTRCFTRIYFEKLSPHEAPGGIWVVLTVISGEKEMFNSQTSESFERNHRSLTVVLAYFVTQELIDKINDCNFDNSSWRSGWD
ncbi:Protein of unknown function [Cotesia congregata]|uniref:Uncharacterized protein n=1 Tax=Cotesia congregata TaxID=51543 RepID=A0A8J2MM74_COTCN|nr:Protein of unknown function [Cotesia congregata]